MQPTQVPQQHKPPMSREEFNQQYWFSPLQQVTVINPKADDFPFMVEMRHYIIRKGATETFPGVIANVYLDQMAKIIAQDEDNLGFMADPNMKRLYYDRLIVTVKNLVEEYNAQPAYMQNVAAHTQVDAPSETPPWQNDSAPVAPPPAPEPPAKEEVREFEYDGAKYKMITTKQGRNMYYKDGSLTSEAVYSKAASM